MERHDSFIHSTNSYLLSSCYVPVTIVDTRDVLANNTDKDPALVIPAFRWGERRGMGRKIINK